MLKVFISHSDTEDPFATWLKEKLGKDFPQGDIFVDHLSSQVGDEAHIFLTNIGETHFFIPIYSQEYSQRDNCKAEFKHACECGENNTNKLPKIFPIRFKCPNELLPSELPIKLDSSGNSTGIIWEDFSNEKEWDAHYEKLLKALSDSVVKLQLDTDENFFHDAEHIDLILKRVQPTSSEIQIIMDVYLKQEEYQRHFFAKLDSPEWLNRLNLYGFFRRNPHPIESEQQTGSYHIPYWPVLDYLEKISLECCEPHNEKYADKLIQIIRDVTNNNGQKVDNYRTWWVFTKILINLPSAVITLEDIDLIAIWVNSKFDKPFVVDIGQELLPKFLESDNPQEHQKALRIIEIINNREFAVRKGMDSYYLEKIYSNKNCRLLGERCGEHVITIILSHLSEAVDNDGYSYMWRPAIEEHAQNTRTRDDLREIWVSALRDVLLSFLEKRSSNKKDILNQLLFHDLIIVKRIAIFAIGKHWKQYKRLFWDFIRLEHFDDSNFRHEIYMLLKERYNLFGMEERKIIVNVIEQGASLIPDVDDETKEEKQKYLVFWKQRWLSAMIEQGDEKINTLYNKCKEITKIDPEHPEFASYTSITNIKFPLTTEELLGKAVPDIVRYLNEFTSTEGWDNPTEAGLALVLQQAAKENPAKFEAELDKFLNVKLLYIARMIAGFEESWRSKNYINLNWGRILSFCRDIVINPGFWKKEEDGDKYDYTDQDRVVEAISSLIEGGTKNDEWAFDPSYLSLAEQILLKLNENQASQMKEKEIKDAINTALNTAKGHIVRALVNYALRVARVEKELGTDKAVKWSDSVKNEFDKELGKYSEERSLEFSTFMGDYLPQLYFLDQSWVIDNINKIFPKEIPSHWKVAMQGYLWSSPYNHIYALLKENSHYEFALKTEFESSPDYS